MPANGRSIKLGPCESLQDLKNGIRILARALGQLGDYTGASRNLAMLASIEFRTKELELKGLNMDGTAPEVVVTLNDYATTHDEVTAQLKAKDEEIAALEAQIAAMGARERPRPPRPSSLN